MAQWSADARKGGHRVGLVPTMGALHAGHMDLVRRALDRCGRVVVSIFVNPLQFDKAEDLANYPRRVEADLALLERSGCHAVFLPEAKDLFAGYVPRTFDLGGLDLHWEGPSRPGHFQGVVNVVERLFHYARPDDAFFGEKDRQQLAIIGHVTQALLWPEHIVACPTVREADCLAMSSRNLRLSAQERQQATVLYRALQSAAAMALHASMEQTRQAALVVLAQEPAVRLDYFGIAHPGTLEPISEWTGLDEAVALIAAYVGPVRLIDNVTLRL